MFGTTYSHSIAIGGKKELSQTMAESIREKNIENNVFSIGDIAKSKKSPYGTPRAFPKCPWTPFFGGKPFTSRPSVPYWP